MSRHRFLDVGCMQGSTTGLLRAYTYYQVAVPITFGIYLLACFVSSVNYVTSFAALRISMAAILHRPT